MSPLFPEDCSGALQLKAKESPSLKLFLLGAGNKDLHPKVGILQPEMQFVIINGRAPAPTRMDFLEMPNGYSAATVLDMSFLCLVPRIQCLF